MHNGFINVDNEKMSKVGNFFTIRDVLKEYDAETVRFFIVRSHYRSPLNYSDVHLDDARRAQRLYTALSLVAPQPAIDWANRMPRASRRPWTKTSARPRPWPCCSSWPARSTAQVARWPACSRRWRLPGPAAGRPRGLSAGRRGLDAAAIEAQIAARAAAKAAKNCRGRPHPRRAAGPGHRAQGLGRGHDLGGRAVMIQRNG
jgi:cysteinyl-tRNA synthetase